MAHELTASYLAEARAIFKQYKRLAERAMTQAPDEALTAVPDGESNSISQIVKHVAGNMQSRWTDFLASDGEKPGRNRDSEFEQPPNSRAEMMEAWEAGWKCLFDALEPLSDADLGRIVLIRSEAHSVMQAISRQVAHYSYHVGQIVYLAKHYAGGQWAAITIPRGKSADFTARVAEGKASQR